MSRTVIAGSILTVLSLAACGGSDTRTVVVNPAPPQAVVVPSYSPAYAVPTYGPVYTAAPAEVVVAPPNRYAMVVVPQQGVAVVCPTYQPNCYSTYIVEDSDRTAERDHR